MLSLLWLVVWKTLVNVFFGTLVHAEELLGIVDPGDVNRLLLDELRDGAGWGEIYAFFWAQPSRARRLLEQHERRERLKDAWR
jgi:hypothetical protein